MMKAISMAVMAALAGPAAAGEMSDREQAVAAVGAFGKALKAELVSAMESGGPVAAIDVCSKKAPVIANQVSLEKGVTVSRVSLRNRNPDNAASDWQKEVLFSFEKRAAAGEDPMAISWEGTAEGQEYRFMKAIPTGGVCLACHGETLDPSISQKLAELYPGDQATGYSMGDIRGAFVVVKK